MLKYIHINQLKFHISVIFFYVNTENIYIILKFLREVKLLIFIKSEVRERGRDKEKLPELSFCERKMEFVFTC
mgnify:CR=1 FL=1